MISSSLLTEYGAQEIEYTKGEIIFEQSQRPDYFYQIKSGTVIMTSLNESGKEFTQGIFKNENSFGTPVLFIEKTYPSTAKTVTDCTIYKLHKEHFHKLIHDYPEYLLKITKKLSELLFFKAKMGVEISLHSPKHRILTLLKHIKIKETPEKIELTRQQIANLTALRTETVIRTIKMMENSGELQIIKGKIYL